MRTKVTIGICLRNCEEDVTKIVKRICKQDFPHEDMEVIFVDDGSQDNTLLCIQLWAPSLGMKYAVYHHKWKGLGFSRNVVLKNAKGKYILWVDDGTLIPEDYVRLNIGFMEKHPEIGIARGVIGVYNGPSRIAFLENMIAITFYNKDVGNFTKKLPGTGGSVYRSSAARQVNGFNESIQGATEDMDIVYRMVLSNWKIYITPASLFLDYDEKIGKVWNKSLWYGYGAHFTLHKHKGLSETLYKSTPLAGFIQGILVSTFAYKETRAKIAFFLPFFYFIKRSAFCLGFAKSHFDAYGH